MKRFVVALCLVLASLSAARAESVLRSMVTTDTGRLLSWLRDLPGISFLTCEDTADQYNLKS
ncbi:hypothetical protein DCG74_32520 [Bradyrhizobium sp. WBAH42]|nr:hypothetical protein [Bradyrhizobium sp. WBAH30]MDD1542511.1 hypothetical protein [Bradyrhizobium sp. WBAH41]MDD1556663.1 hypothetical protein [Bradyrhizobium sp. WBAH23]MDD1561496.1 hypothetical protein [Bradyrhizobium sp. WBAH33]MDD1589482.1 hypothetical protein [Bradyrhizobium sp. WBAH42]NRB87980.1 hypothetical protein [Bradyrhizobium sp. WBAH10]QCJ92766.1 hypothetical protein DAA57_32965 [Bradyrhizobium yuanmingense]